MFHLIGAIHAPLKNMKVNWDDKIPNTWKIKIPVPNHTPVGYVYLYQIPITVIFHHRCFLKKSGPNVNKNRLAFRVKALKGETLTQDLALF